MERQPRFDLTSATEAWLDALRQRGALTDDDLRELRAHLLDAVDSLKTGGLSEEEAFLVACHRLGSAEAVSAEFGKIQRPFMVQREPVIFLLGALAFVVLKNGLDAGGFGVSHWLVTRITDDRLVALADFGVRLLLFAGFIAVLAVYFRRGETLHRRLFAWLHRAPVGVALSLTALIGAVQFLWFFGERNVARLLRDLPHRDLYDLRLNERLFAYGVYLAWLVAFVLVAVRQHNAGKRSFWNWFGQAHLVPLLLLGWSVFLGFFVGIGFEIMHRLAGISETFIVPGASLLFCLTGGFVMARNHRYSLPVRFAIVVAPVLILCAIGFVENPSDTLNFLMRNGTAAVFGATAGLGMGAWQQRRTILAR